MPRYAPQTRAAKYRTRVTIERLKSSATIDASGHVNEADDDNWEKYAERWCSIRYNSGAEKLIGDGAQSSGVGAYVFRYDTLTSGITSDMRLRLGTRIISVTGPARVVDEGNREVLVVGTEIV